MSYQDGWIDEVRRIDIEKVVGAHVEMKRVGNRLFGSCPFHAENTASFSVSPRAGLFYCFGCHAGGDAIEFRRRLGQLDFMEAVKQLANEFGIEIPERAPRELRFAESRASKIRTLLEDLAACHQRALAKDDETKRYLATRGLGTETVEQARLGAPLPKGGEIDEVLNAHDPELLKLSGVLSEGRDYYLFYNRLIIPILDRRGRVISLAGRDLAGHSKAKYINGRESPVFSKGQELYGQECLTGPEPVVIVEGYFDVLAMRQLGYQKTVAPMGTALTTQQAAQLRRAADVATLVFDADRAGRQATEKAAAALYTADLQVGVVVLSEGTDPGDLIGRGYDSSLRHARAQLAQPADAVLWMMDIHHVPSASASLPERAKRLKKVAALVAHVSDEAMRAEYTRALADRWGVPLQQVHHIVQGLRDNKPDIRLPRVGPVDHTELVIAGMVLTDEEAWKAYIAQPDRSLLTDGALGGVFEEVLASLPLRLTAGEVLMRMDERSRVQVEAAVQAAEESESFFTFESMWGLFRKNWRRNKLRLLLDAMDEAIEQGDEERVAELAAASNRLAVG